MFGSLSSLVVALSLQTAPAAPALPVPEEADLSSEVGVLSISSDDAELETATRTLLEQWGASEKLLTAVNAISRGSATLAAEKFLAAALEKSPHKAVRGYAAFDLAQVELEFDQIRAQLDGATDAAAKQATATRYGARLLESLRGREPGAGKRRAEELLQRVVDDFYLVDHRRAGYLGVLAEAQLFELQHLQLGMTAPEIDGADEDTVGFKLSDYRGKVVVLDFWGFWCPICVRNLPPEKELVKKLEAKPFALVGVNSDPMSQLRTRMKYDRLPWRSFFDGGDAYGPIARRWNVTQWPTIYVLDENGVIRGKTESAEEAGALAESLVATLEAKEAAPKKPKSVDPAPR